MQENYFRSPETAPGWKVKVCAAASRFFLGGNSNVDFKIGAAEKSLRCHCFA